MTGSGPVHRRLLGAALRKHREHLGYTLEDAARILECDRSKISRIETGLRGIRSSELRGLLTEYGVSEPEKSALAGIARAATADSWWLDYDDVLTGTGTGCEYVQLEMAASQLQVYDPQHVPELLQTSGYATALAAGLGHLSGETGSGLTAVTLARQRAILKERQTELSVIIDQAALHRMVGGPQVMRAQLRRLAAAAEEAPHVTVQVLPFSSGVRAAGAGGPATILQFGAPGLGVVYLPRLGQGATCLVSPADLACYTRAFTRLAAAALTPPESARMLAELAGGAVPGTNTLEQPPSCS